MDNFTGSNLILLSKSLGFVLSVGDIDKVPDGKVFKMRTEKDLAPVSKVAHGVAGSADRLVHRVSAPGHHESSVEKLS